eukprot:15435389-Alexandrium_andersonii.AAC.1
MPVSSGSNALLKPLRAVSGSSVWPRAASRRFGRFGSRGVSNASVHARALSGRFRASPEAAPTLF